MHNKFMKGGKKIDIKKIEMHHHNYWIPIPATNADKKFIGTAN